MKYLSICHPKLGVMLVQFPPHVPHHEMLAVLGNPPCLGGGFAVLPDNVAPKPSGQSQSLGKSPAMGDAKLLEMGYFLTRLDQGTSTLFNQAQT